MVAPLAPLGSEERGLRSLLSEELFWPLCRVGFLSLRVQAGPADSAASRLEPRAAPRSEDCQSRKLVPGPGILTFLKDRTLAKFSIWFGGMTVVLINLHPYPLGFPQRGGVGCVSALAVNPLALEIREAHRFKHRPLHSISLVWRLLALGVAPFRFGPPLTRRHMGEFISQAARWLSPLWGSSRGGNARYGWVTGRPTIASIAVRHPTDLTLWSYSLPFPPGGGSTAQGGPAGGGI